MVNFQELPLKNSTIALVVYYIGRARGYFDCVLQKWGTLYLIAFLKAHNLILNTVIS
jgi:hypothetical protein